MANHASKTLTRAKKISPWLNSQARNAFDWTLALCLALLTAPLQLLIAIAILSVDGWPIFFCHRRVGRLGTPITVVKFRTMVADAEAVLPKILSNPDRLRRWRRFRKLTDDPRTTKLGQILRKTSLDELPQLWQVLTGTMSLIGPRPMTQDEMQRLAVSDDHPIFLVKPGISGLVQTSGRHGVSLANRITLEEGYVSNSSWELDLKIIFRTIREVLSRNGC